MSSVADKHIRYHEPTSKRCDPAQVKMTAKEQLHELINELSDEDAEVALLVLDRREMIEEWNGNDR